MPQPLALTLGDPAGIGPDIAILAWAARHDLSLPPFYMIADPDLMAHRAKSLGVKLPIVTIAPAETKSAFADAFPISPIKTKVSAAPGHPDDSSASAAIESIRIGVADVFSGDAAAIVTNPVAKSVLYAGGFRDPGQTEYLARLTEEMKGEKRRAVMMMWSPELVVVPVTIHLRLRDVFGALSTGLIVETGRIVAHDLQTRFQIARPRLAVAALNPHAGEQGAIGDEEITIIAPAIAQLASEGIDVRGPMPADSMFHPAARRQYDAALCMYHDQALIPLKTVDYEGGVNVTLGLPFVRTSPDHGTAFDIAGTGRANPASLIAALRLAARLSAA